MFVLKAINIIPGGAFWSVTVPNIPRIYVFHMSHITIVITNVSVLSSLYVYKFLFILFIYCVGTICVSMCIQALMLLCLLVCIEVSPSTVICFTFLSCIFIFYHELACGGVCPHTCGCSQKLEEGVGCYGSGVTYVVSHLISPPYWGRGRQRGSGSPTKPEVNSLTRLAGQQIPAILLSLPFCCPNIETADTPPSSPFTCILTIWTCVLMLGQQALCPLSPFLIPCIVT